LKSRDIGVNIENHKEKEGRVIIYRQSTEEGVSERKGPASSSRKASLRKEKRGNQLNDCQERE